MGSEFLLGLVVLLSICFLGRPSAPSASRSPQSQAKATRKNPARGDPRIRLPSRPRRGSFRRCQHPMSCIASSSRTAIRILDAHGGALYLVDPADAQALYPTFLSRDCPPLLEIPAAPSPTEGSQPRGHPKLPPPARHRTGGRGASAAVWRDKEPLLLSGQDSRASTALAGFLGKDDVGHVQPACSTATRTSASSPSPTAR